jgi:hypothetical protein
MALGAGEEDLARKITSDYEHPYFEALEEDQ